MTEGVVETSDNQTMQVTDYSPDEISRAQAEENNLAQAQMIQVLQNRNVALNIETRRAQQKALIVEQENGRLRQIIEDFHAEKSDVEPKPDPAEEVERYVAQERDLPRFDED